MKKRVLSLVLALGLCMGLLTVPASAADAKAAKTANIGRNNYNGNWARDSYSILYENAQGGLTRGEYYTSYVSSNGKSVKKHNYTVETYGKGFQLLSSKQISLPEGMGCYGGAFHGEKYNYLIVGMDNRENKEILKSNDQSVESIRIIQFDQNWNELDHVGLTSGETDAAIPFGHGLNCVEAGDYLHIYTARTMGLWVTNDGTNHETNLYITVNQENLSAKVVTNGIGSENAIHVAHSFAHHILINDEGKIVTVTHGDGDPRNFRLSVLPGSAESMDPTDGGEVTSLDLTEFTPADNPWEMSDLNQTDAELAGIAEAGNAYVVAYKNVTTRYSKRIRGDYQNVYMARIPKDNLTADGIQAIKVTDETLRVDAQNSNWKADGDLFSSTPVLVSTGKNTGYVMWTNLKFTNLGSGFGFSENRVTDQLFILPYDATTAETFAASMSEEPIELKGNLSDCQPFVYNGNVVWYTTGQYKSLKETHGTQSSTAGHESTPVFYVFDGSSITTYQDGKKVDVPDAFWTEASSKPTTPAESNDPAVQAALEKDAELVENFVKNSIPTEAWTKSQFQNAMNSLMKQNADASGNQTTADVWYYKIKEDHIDIQLTLKRSGQELKIDKILTMELPSSGGTTKDELALVNPNDPNTMCTPTDASEVQSARNYIERLLKEELKFDNNATADSVLNTLQNILTRRKNKAELSWGKTGFSLTPATGKTDGKITGNLLFTCGTARCGLALDALVKSVNNADLLRADTEAVQAALDAMNLNNDLTQEKVEAVIQGAIQNGSSFQIFGQSGFYLKKATKSNTGTLIVACLMTNGDLSRSFELNYTIPKTGDQKSDQPAFTDVAAGAYYAEPVAWAVEKGITNGTSNTTFSPDATCTQVQILTFLWRAAGKPDSTARLPFTLNDGLEYADGALRWAVEKGMINASFDQTAPCTRASAVKYIWQAFGSKNAAASSFTDVSANANYAKAVNWAVENGITNGTSDTTFSPSNTCTRGQIVTFLSRAYNK